MALAAHATRAIPVADRLRSRPGSTLAFRNHRPSSTTRAAVAKNDAPSPLGFFPKGDALRGWRSASSRAPGRPPIARPGVVRGVLLRAKKDDLERELNDHRQQLDVARKELEDARGQAERVHGLEERARNAESERDKLGDELRGARDELHNAREELDRARKDVQDAEELFYAAADERAAKVKELVEEIDKWQDAAQKAQHYEGEQRAEAERARNEVNEANRRVAEAERARDEAYAAANDNNNRAQEEGGRVRELEERANSLQRQVEEKDARVNELKRELDLQLSTLEDVDGLVQAAKKEAEDAWRQMQESEAKFQGSTSTAADLAKQLEDARARGNERENELQALQGQVAELSDVVSKKEWYLGERTAELERAREELEQNHGLNAAAAEKLRQLAERAETARVRAEETDAELERLRTELEVAKQTALGAEDGAMNAARAAADALKESNERVNEARATIEERNAEIEKRKAEIDGLRQEIVDMKNEHDMFNYDDDLRAARERVKEAETAKEHNEIELDHLRSEFDDMRQTTAAAADEANARVRIAEERAEQLKNAVEAKEREVSLVREELNEARREGSVRAATADEAKARLFRAEERAETVADEARQIAIAASEKIEKARDFADSTQSAHRELRHAKDRVRETETQVAAMKNVFEEAQKETTAARIQLAKTRVAAANNARIAADAQEAAAERFRLSEANVVMAQSARERMSAQVKRLSHEADRARRLNDDQSVFSLEEQISQTLTQRDARAEEIEWLQGELHQARTAYDAAVHELHGIVREGDTRVADKKRDADEKAKNMADRRHGLEEARADARAAATAADEAAQAVMRAEERAADGAREAHAAGQNAVEKMAISLEAAKSAYEVATHRENALRSELNEAEREAAENQNSGQRESHELRARIDEARRAASYATELEEQSRSAAEQLAHAKRRFTEVDQSMSDRRPASQKEAELRAAREEIERSRRIAEAAIAIKDERRLASIATVEAKSRGRAAEEAANKMRDTIERKERELVEVKAEIEQAVGEFESATRESEAAMEEERRLANAGSFGGGGGGGRVNELRATVEERDKELSVMRGTVEEAKRTAAAAADLVDRRRAAASDAEFALARSKESAANANANAGGGYGAPYGGTAGGDNSSLRDAQDALQRAKDEYDAKQAKFDAGVQGYRKADAELQRLKAEGYSKDDPEAVRWFQERDKADAFLTKGQDIVKDAKSEVERLQALVDAKERESSQPSSYDSGYGGGGSGGDDVMRLEMELQIAKTAHDEASNIYHHADQRSRDIAASLESKERDLERLRRELSDAQVSAAADVGGGGTEEQRRAAAVAAVEMRFRARQAEERANKLRGAVESRQEEINWMRGEHEAARRELDALSVAAQDAASREREIEQRANDLAEEATRASYASQDAERNAQQSYDVDDRLRRELDEAKTRFDYATQEADRKRNDAARAAADRDNKIEALEFSLSRVDMPPMEARYAAEDTATASFRLRQIEDRLNRMEAMSGQTKGKDVNTIRDEIEQSRLGAIKSAAAVERATESLRKAEGMTEAAREFMEIASSRAADAAEAAAKSRRAAMDAAVDRERTLRDELAAAAAAVRERNATIESLEINTLDLETRLRETTTDARSALANAEAMAKNSELMFNATHVETTETVKRLEAALNRAERELRAMEQAMLQELTTSEVALLETKMTGSETQDKLEQLRRELQHERERANTAADDARAAYAKAAAAEAGNIANRAALGEDHDEAFEALKQREKELVEQISGLETTLAAVIGTREGLADGDEGFDPDDADRIEEAAARKLMLHIKSLQAQVKEGRDAMAMQETIIAEQMRLREEAEFAKYEKDDAERKVQEIENLATQLWSQLENAGIDPGSHLRFTPIERQPYTSPTPQIDPQMEELTKKLLQTDDDLEQLMAEILEDTMEVEMAASKEELEKAKEEIEHLKGELRRWK